MYAIRSYYAFSRSNEAEADQIGLVYMAQAGYRITSYNVCYTKLLRLIGAAMGLIAGFLVSYLLIFVINKQSFGWTIQVHHPAGFLVIATVLFLVIALFAGHTPARMAARLNPREAA